jgi:hypothetical protein
MRVDSAWGAVAALAASQHGAFNRKQAADHGVRSARLRRMLAQGLLEEPVPGVLVVHGSAPTWHRDLSVATLAVGGRAVVGMRSAAALHRLDGSRAEVVEIIVPARTRSLEVPGATVHRYAGLVRSDLVQLDGIRCTSVARTLADLGSVVPIDVVQKGLDDARRRKVSTTWLADVARRVNRPGVTGPGILLGLLEEAERVPIVPESWLERLLELCLTTPELPPIVRQHVIRCSSTGRVLARVDLAIPDLLLGIEGHSRQHHFGASAQRSDEERDLLVAAEGWELLYLGWHAALEPDVARRRVVAVASARARLLGSRPTA